MSDPHAEAQSTERASVLSRAPVPSLAPVVFVLVAAKLALHLVTAGAYGWHGDELYYQACAERLAWGYVDHPPLSIAITAAWGALGGPGLFFTRIPSAVAGAASVLGTALIARELGGRAWAQGVAALVTLLAPVLLVMHGYASMNALDTALWVMVMWQSLRVAAAPRRGRWLVLGALIGFGLLNKWSIAWLVGGLIVGWTITPLRKQFLRGDFWLAALLALGIVFPHLVWQFHHGWPTIEFLMGLKKYQLESVGPLGLGLLAEQMVVANPVASVVWGIGLVVLLGDGERPGARPLAIVFLFVFLLLAFHGASKGYYLSLALPPLIAAGAVWLETKSNTVRFGRIYLGTYVALVALTGAALLPLSLRLLPPEKLIGYQTVVNPTAPHVKEGRLDYHFGQYFGWEELAQDVRQVYAALPPEERERAVIFTPTYSEASALEFFGEGLPVVCSGHNSYWLWGPPEEPSVVIIVGGYGLTQDIFAPGWDDIEEVARTRCTWCLPGRTDRTIWLARDPKAPLREMWPAMRHYD